MENCAISYSINLFQFQIAIKNLSLSEVTTKVVVVGDGAAGKSSILLRMQMVGIQDEKLLNTSKLFLCQLDNCLTK